MLINHIKLSCAKETTLLADLVVEVLKCWTLNFWRLRNNGERIFQRTLFAAMLLTHVAFLSCNVALKCYVTAGRSPGNYSVRSMDLFLLRNLLCRSFSRKKSLQFGNKMLHFSLSIKDMNLLVGLVQYLNFWCHFGSEVAGNFCQSNWRNRWLPATIDSPALSWQWPFKWFISLTSISLSFPRHVVDVPVDQWPIIFVKLSKPSTAFTYRASNTI